MTELFSIKAGRAFRRDATNFVDPDPSKGHLALEAGNDGLLYLRWRTRDGSFSTRENIVRTVGDIATFTIDYILFSGKHKTYRSSSFSLLMRHLSGSLMILQCGCMF